MLHDTYSYYLKIKEFISDKEIEKEIEEKLQSDFYKNLPEAARASCSNCEKIPQIERSCEYYNIQFQYFLIFSASIIYDEIRRFDKIQKLQKDLKEAIVIEYLRSITVSPEGFGLHLGKLIEMLTDNELYQTTIELGKENLEDRYKICLDNLKELKNIEKYAEWKIKDGLIFNKWADFWTEENKNVINKINYDKWEHPIKNHLLDLSSEIDIPLNLKLGVTEHSWHKSDDKVKVYHVFINAYQN